jgi:hypothetical protein
MIVTHVTESFVIVMVTLSLEGLDNASDSRKYGVYRKGKLQWTCNITIYFYGESTAKTFCQRTWSTVITELKDRNDIERIQVAELSNKICCISRALLPMSFTSRNATVDSMLRRAPSSSHHPRRRSRRPGRGRTQFQGQSREWARRQGGEVQA